MPRPFAVSLCLLFVLWALPACKSNCQQLSEKLCDCTLNTADQTSCQQRASTESGLVQVSAQQDKNCAALLATCDCHTIGTPAGKVACGLARASPSDAGPGQ